MAIRAIKTWPDAILATKCAAVAEHGAALERLVKDLFDTMYASDGIGLAANQIGVDARVVVIDLDPQGLRFRDRAFAKELALWGYEKPLALINPQIIAAKGSLVWEEGCLSVPEINADVERKSEISVRAETIEGHSFTFDARGLFAICIQHELDHLEGIVFVERLGPKARRRAEAMLEARLLRRGKKTQKRG